MNRREAIVSLAGMTGACTLPKGSDVKTLADADGGNNGIYLLCLDGDPLMPLPESEIERILVDWKGAWPTGKAPNLVVLPPGCRISGPITSIPLPGRYAVNRQIEGHIFTVTFQTLEEMKEWVADQLPGIYRG